MSFLHSTKPTNLHSSWLSMHMLHLYLEDSFIDFKLSLSKNTSSKLVVYIIISKI